MLTEDQYNSRSIWIVSEDGFWDICIGLLLLGIGITITIDQFIWFIGIFLLVYFMVLMAGKEAVTRPRINNFEFQKNQLRNFTLTAVIDILILILILGISAVMFVKFEGGLTSGYFDNYAILILGIIGSLLLIQFGFLLTRGVRFFLYAGLILSAASISHILNIPIVPIIYIIGAIFTIIGITFLVRFIYRYPTSGTQSDVKI